MRLHFKTNDYLLTWNLLYGASFSESVHQFKTKQYKEHKKLYNDIAKDKDEMLRDIKNFIPDDDTLYNYVFETHLFNRLKNDTEKHRNKLLEIWDKNKRVLNKELKNILKYSLKDDYTIIVLHPIMDSVLVSKDMTTLGWGNKKDLKNPILTLCNIIYTIVENEMGEFNKKYKDIVDVCLELAIKNELYVRLSGKSTYLDTKSEHVYLKRQIYPYFLMYLGYEKDDFPRFMRRDGITFEIDGYLLDNDLTKLNLIEFIKFCIENQRKIIRISQIEIL